jgi:hypothetical protein
METALQASGGLLRLALAAISTQRNRVVSPVLAR